MKIPPHRRHFFRFVAALLLLTPLPLTALAQPGSLDPTFGTNGITRIGFGDGYDQSNALALQIDGGYLVAGSAGSCLTVAKYLYSGAPDPAFGERGVTRLCDRNGSSASGIAVQTDGRIVVVGSENGGQTPLVARFLSTGALDTSFGVGGFAVMTSLTGFGAYAVSMQGTRILVAGALDASLTAASFAVCRLTPAGVLDSTFDGDGIQSTTMSNRSSATSLTLQPDGKIVLAGWVQGTIGAYVAALVRYDANGVLDTSFDGDGRVTTTVGASTNVTMANAVIAISFSSTSHRLLIAGRTGTSTQSNGLLVRYNLDGSLDTVFGSGGVVVQSVSLDTDRFTAVRFVLGTTHTNPTKIFVGGYTEPPTGHYDALLCCYTVSGALYTGFGGGDGIVTTPIGSSQDEIRAMLLSGDRLVVTGYATQGQEQTNFMLARFLATTGALDPSLDGDGILLDDIADSGSTAYAMARQADGRIVLAGYTRGGYEQALARIKPDGSPDSSFSGDGRATHNVGSSTDYLTDVALQADQKIVVVGTALLSNQSVISLTRFLPDGSLDLSFGGMGLGSITTRLMSNDRAYSVAVQSDGHILIAGVSSSSTASLVRVSRYGPTGVVDISFGVNGHLTLNCGGEKAYDGIMALQPDGRIIIAARRLRMVGSTPIYELVVLRLTATGAFDPTFGTVGLSVPGVPTGGVPTDVLVQPDGRIVVTGIEYITTTDRNPFALRLTAGGQLDPTFGSAGYQVISSSPVDESALAAALQPDGRLLVAGRTGTDSVNDQFVARLVTSGPLDPSFSGDGLAALDCGSPNGDDANDILATDPDRVLVAGAGGGLMCVAAVDPGLARTGVGEPVAPEHPLLVVGNPWPMPATAGVSLTIRVAESAPVSAEVLDVSGRLIRMLNDSERLAAGEHRLNWDGRDTAGTLAASGLYFMRVQSDGRAVSRRVLLAR